MNFKFNFLLVLVSFVFACDVNAQAVNVDTFEKDLKAAKNPQLLDVRTAGEFETGYLQGAMWADWRTKDEFNRRTVALDKDKTVYIYCLSGGRSAAAAKDLRDRGFKDVVEMQGGINAWKQADKPLVVGKKAPQISEDDFQGMLASSKVVLVDFGAEWCAPCRKMNPIIDQIEKDNKGKVSVVRIDAASQDDLVKAKKVEQLPTFVIYNNGKEVWRKSGIVAKAELESELQTVK